MGDARNEQGATSDGLRHRNLFMLQSKGVIRRIIEDKDRFLVSFPKHDGYFHADQQDLRDRLCKAQEERREISFTYDPTLKILSLT